MRLKRLFYIHQEVRARPDFDPVGKTNGTATNTSFTFGVGRKEEGFFQAVLKISVNEEKSENAPYSFRFHLAAEVECSDEDMAQPAKLQYTVFSMLVGAIRERLADLTARGPYPYFLLGPLGIPKFSDTFDAVDDEAEEE